MFKPTPEQITSWIASNFEYKSRKNGDELLIANPFYHNDKMKMNVSTSKGLVHDWRGDNSWAKGNSPTFLRFVQLYNKCSFAEAIKIVCGESVSLRSITKRITDERNKQHAEDIKDRQLKDLILPAGSLPVLTSPEKMMSAMAKNYLNSRGINDDMIKIYDIHHCADDIVWPYYEYEDLVYYQSRNIINKRFRFPDESFGVGKSEFLYGFDMVEPSDYIIVTEAIFDAMSLGAQCVASGGVIISKSQVRKIRALNPVNGVILAPDNDKAAIESILDNSAIIGPYFKMFCAIPPVCYGDKKIKDWNDLLRATGDFIKTRDIFEKSVKRITPSLLVDLSHSL